jgi:hypothetical protein
MFELLKNLRKEKKVDFTELSPERYQNLVQEYNSKTDYVSIPMAGFIDISEKNYVENAGAGPCLIMWVKVDGKMTYSAHMPIALDTGDQRDAYSLNKFQTAMDFLKNLVLEGKVVEVALFGQSDFFNDENFPKEVDFVTKSLSKAIGKDNVVDKREKKKLVRTSVFYDRLSKDNQLFLSRSGATFSKDNNQDTIISWLYTVWKKRRSVKS